MPFKKGDIIRVFGCGVRGSHGCTAMLEVEILEISSHTPEELPDGMTVVGRILDYTPCPTCGEFKDAVIGSVEEFCGSYRPDYYEHHGLQL